MVSRNEWRYYDEKLGEWTKTLISLEALDQLHMTGQLYDHTMCVNTFMLRRGKASNGIRYDSIVHIRIDFQPEGKEFFESRLNNSLTVLSGPNNTGKTLLLKKLFSEAGHGAYMLSCNRFAHVDQLNTRLHPDVQYHNYYDNFVQSWFTSTQNTESNEYTLELAITGLSDSQRVHLFKICGDLLGSTIDLRRLQANNVFSPYYVDVDGQNLRCTSTGTRLLLVLFGTILNERFEVLMIDEPELGLSPRVQAEVVRLLYDPGNFKQYWPHLKHIFIATHSHLFLDRKVISNNYSVEKRADVVSVSPIQTIGAFHVLQFNMLGNSFESIFLPSAIVIVEGETDVTFLSKVMTFRMPNKRIAIVRAGGDGGVVDKLSVLSEAFGKLDASPYRGRVFVVLDSRHSANKTRIVQKGVLEENVTVWPKNGIEYYYPTRLVANAFRCEIGEVAKIDFETDPIEYRGFRLTKKELATHVSDQLIGDNLYESELDELLRSIGRAAQ